MNDRQRLEAIIAVVCKYLPPDGISIEKAMNEIISLVDPLPPQQEHEPVCPECKAEVLYECVACSRNNYPPQRTEQELVACERCKQLEEQAYDLLGQLKVANLKLSVRSQRTWVGLTDEELSILGEKFTHPDEGIDEVDFGMEIQRILKEKNFD